VVVQLLACSVLLSKKKMICLGTPQGTVLSPDLYNFNVNNFPSPDPRHLLQVSSSDSFGDDFDIGESSPDVSTLTNNLNVDLAKVAQWAKDKKILISPNKSGVILFTPDQKQYHLHPQVFLDGKLIPLHKALKMLGINFDPKINFGTHNSVSCVKGNGRVPVMKALAGTSWGHHMETLLLTYKSLVRPTFTFGSPYLVPQYQCDQHSQPSAHPKQVP
jgi:hypothetical protein